jgi:hypothetical protein
VDGLKDAIKYFSEFEDQADEQYKKGKILSYQLLDMRESERFVQKEFDEYLQDLENIDSCGSMYFWLWGYSVSLGYKAGLRVPVEHVWGDRNKGKLKCIDSGTLFDLIIKGNWYTVLDEDSKPGFIRVIAENNKHRWIPVSCFEEKVEHERTFKQKL